jgi:two-component system sensor histidine kinase/response regulator
MPHQPTKTDTESLNVLVVEDDEFNQALAIAMLTKLGHTGVVVANGEQAVRCLASRQFDVVLMDIMMPVMDGLAALAAIRAREKIRGGHVPIIMATGHAEPGDGSRLRQAGADGYVTKPIDALMLDAELKRVLDHG